jgi:rubrerythrin
VTLEEEQRPPPRPESEPVCLVQRVCAECGRLADEEPPTRCPACGAELPAS